MKRKDVIKRIEDGGGEFIRHGSKHDIYRGPNGVLESVPRHKVIKKMTAEKIFKRLGV